MGEALNDIKIRLIRQITLLNDAQVLQVLEKLLQAKPLNREDLLLLTLATSVRAKTDLEELAREQNYGGPNRTRFEQAAAQINLQEPIDELLAQLTS